MYLSSDGITNILASLSLLLSLLLAFFYVRDRRHARFAIENDYANDLLRWHGEVVGVLQSLRLADAEFAGRNVELARLSALIEQGRFFFPNIDRDDGFGDDKPPAYRGYRNLALDFLVAYYNIMSSGKSAGRDEQAEILQRHFTSVVFELVRPHQRLEMIRVMTDRYFVQENCFEDFIDHKDGKVLEAVWRKPA